jgi:hypothetical protein
MAYQLSNAEAEELFFIEAGLRHDRGARFYGVMTDQLIANGLLVMWGTSVRLTALGEGALLRLRNGVELMV